MNELKHYGVPGMKWGVRRTFARNIYRKGRKIHSKGDVTETSGVGIRTKVVLEKINSTPVSRLSASQSIKGKQYISKYSDGIILPSNDYRRVMGEIHTYDPDCRQKDNIDFHDSSDGYTYTYRNRRGDEPLITGKQPIKNTHKK